MDRHVFMERFATVSSPPLIWHIVWQAVEGRDLMVSAALIDRIRMRLLEAHRQPDRALLLYVLTPTELHLLTRLPCEVAPRRLVCAIGNIVARWVGEAQRMPGGVFTGRYRAYAIESEEMAQREFRMLAWRPVELGLCRAPTHYTNSSLRATLGLKRALGFDSLAPLRVFGDSVPEARATLRRQLAKRPGAVERRQWELSRGMVLAPGHSGSGAVNTRSVRGLAAALVAASQPQSIEGALGLLERWVVDRLGGWNVPGLEALSAFVAARARALVACLAVELDLCSASSAARHFGRSKATLSERMAACRIGAEDRSILRISLGQIVEEAIELQKEAASHCPR